MAQLEKLQYNFFEKAIFKKNGKTIEDRNCKKQDKAKAI